MNILVANHWLKKLGGSETFTYTLIEELVRLGHDVSYYTNQLGLVSKKIEQDLSVCFENAGEYDLILCSHNTTVDFLYNRTIGPIIQTCHGPIPKLEQPSPKADAYVAVSKEVELHLLKAGVDRPVLTIHNGINLDRFCPKSIAMHEIKIVLSLSHSEELNKYLRNYFSSRYVHLDTLNKYKNPQWHIEDVINAADLVISAGRGAMESMACGRPVLIMDHRPYMDPAADGLITHHNFETLLFSNFSGRCKRMDPYDHTLIEDAVEQLDSDTTDRMRVLARTHFDIREQVKKYMQFYEQIN